MAVHSGKLPAEYTEPERSAFRRKVGGEREMPGYRLARIAGRLSVFEPLQSNVLRYPPIFVGKEMPQDAAEVQEYTLMPFSNRSELLRGHAEELESGTELAV